MWIISGTSLGRAVNPQTRVPLRRLQRRGPALPGRPQLFPVSICLGQRGKAGLVQATLLPLLSCFMAAAWGQAASVTCSPSWRETHLLSASVPRYPLLSGAPKEHCYNFVLHLSVTLLTAKNICKSPAKARHAVRVLGTQQEGVGPGLPSWASSLIRKTDHETVLIFRGAQKLLRTMAAA